MRKFLTVIILSFGLLFGMTGFANVTAYDSGPPEINYALNDDVNTSSFFVIPSGENQTGPVVSGEYPAAASKVTVTPTTTKEESKNFIDRHRRTGFWFKTIKSTEKKNTIKFSDRHRLR